MILKKELLRLMNNAVFGKAMENKRKHIDIKLVTTDSRGTYLVLQQKYYATN